MDNNLSLISIKAQPGDRITRKGIIISDNNLLGIYLTPISITYKLFNDIYSTNRREGYLK